MGEEPATSPDVVRRATLAALRKAEEMRLQTVAFPAFGTGVGRVAPNDAAEAMVAAIKSHLTEAAAGTSLRRVHFILFQDDIYRAFLTTLGLGGARRVG